MKSGLEEFLKRIEAKPTNETLIDRFMTLVLEEDGIDRILYLKSLVGLLLKSNPYAALKAAYVELQEARKEKLSREYEIGALKDVESCFIDLGRAENAALVREEISKLQSEAPLMQSQTRPIAPRARQTTLVNPIEFPGIPGDDENVNNIPTSAGAEQSRMGTPHHTVMSDLSRVAEATPTRPPENKAVPGFPSQDPRTTQAPVPLQSQNPIRTAAPTSSPVPGAASVVPRAAPQVAPAPAASDPLFNEDMFSSNGEPSHSAPFELAAPDPARVSPSPNRKPENQSLSGSHLHPNQSSNIDLNSNPSPHSNSKFIAPEAAFNPMGALESEDPEDGFGFSLEYTKRAQLPTHDNAKTASDNDNFNSSASSNIKAQTAPVKAVRTTQTGFSLKDDIGENAYISVSTEIDEKFENQPFFQPDDDDEEVPTAERTMLISLEKLNESNEQINLAKTSSSSVKNVNYPVNSGPNFVVLDSDDDVDTVTDLPAAGFAYSGMGTASDDLSKLLIGNDFDLNSAVQDHIYNPTLAPFVFKEPAPPLTLAIPPVAAAPAPRAQAVAAAASAPAQAAPVPAKAAAPAPAQFVTPTPQAVAAPAPTLAPADFYSTAPGPTTAAPSFNLESEFPRFPNQVPALVESYIKVESQAAPSAAPAGVPMPQTIAMPSPIAAQPQATVPPVKIVAAFQSVTLAEPLPLAFRAENTILASSPGLPPSPALATPAPRAKFEITPQKVLSLTSHTAKDFAEEDDDEDKDDSKYKYANTSKKTIDRVKFEAIDDDAFEGEANTDEIVSASQLIGKWTVVQERLKLLSGMQIGRAHAMDFVKRLLNVKIETPVVHRSLTMLNQFVEARLNRAFCIRIGAWLFEELEPQAMHQLWQSLNLGNEGLELYLHHLSELSKRHQHRRALSIMHDVLRFELDLGWYKESYPHLLRVWDRLGLEGWVWHEEEGGAVFCDRLARREDPHLATLLI